MIELDVQLSRDGELVVFHDAMLERTTNGYGAVCEHDLKDLKQLDAGSWFDAAFAGERLLTLTEVTDLVGTRARLNIEVKADGVDWSAVVPTLVSLMRRRGLVDTAVVSCFDMNALSAVRQHDASISIGLLWQNPDFTDAWQCAHELRAMSIHPHWTLCSELILREAKIRGLEVLAWTVNDLETMRALVRQGVQGIMSDYPDRLAVA